MDIIEIIKAIIYGIVEGITEWLPVSSTGHLIILNDFLMLKGISEEFWDLFLVVIQLGAIIAVIISFFSKLWPFGKNKSNEEKKMVWKSWLNIIIACIPAAVVGILLDDWLDEHLYNKLTVSITLIVYGILFIVLEIFNSKRTFSINEMKDLTWKSALIIGCAQMLSLIPGTSRSGITILGAMLIGCNRNVSAEFSFYLSIPVMIGASLLKVVKFALSGALLSLNEGIILFTGCIVSFAVSILIVNFLMKFIKKHDFKIFGIYRICLGILLLVLFFVEIL